MNESKDNSTYTSNSNPRNGSLESLLNELTPSDYASVAQRWIPILAGGTLALIGLSRKTAFGLGLAAAGGALAYYGSRNDNDGEEKESVARGSVLLNSSPEEAYGRYRNFEDFPTFMHHLQSVTKIGDRQYRWTALGPMDIPIQWDAEIWDEKVGEFISWRSLPGSAVTMEGTVRFGAAPVNRGTFLRAVTRFEHPAGQLGRAIAKLFGKDPSFMMQQDLRRFKALLETGEIPTTEGQPQGPRSGVDVAMQSVNPDRPKRPESQMSENLNNSWRTA
jgi:uncharacterized membrane protein